MPPESVFEELYAGCERGVSTTMAMDRLITNLLRDKERGDLIVLIVTDEARTFGMEAMFRQFGIYSSVGQLYEPVDAATLLPYREAKSGQLINEGITEAGSMSSFIAAGTAYATHGINTIPIYMYYSMFGPQRVGDLMWAAGDLRCRGFLVGGTAGRTTLNGEGLQHQDGHSHLLLYALPNLKAYDPAFSYEVAVIVKEGIRRMYKEQEDLFYYLTVENENYAHPPMPEGAEEGIIRGMYKVRPSELKEAKNHAQLFGSGAILNEVLKAQEILAEKYDVAADVWSVTSYKSLYWDAIDAERWNLLNPGKKAKEAYVTECLKDESGVFVAASDYVRALPESIARWVPGTFHTLGTDGFGRSETRQALRDFFEVDARYIVLSTLTALNKERKVTQKVLKQAIEDLGINPEKVNPHIS